MAPFLDRQEPPAITQERAGKLGRFLSPLLEKYHTSAFLDSDPLKFVHRYSAPADREAAALIAAALAYGNVRTIFSSVERVLALLGPRPSGTLAGFDRRQMREALKAFRHRFNTGDDVLLLLHWMGRSFEKHGSLGEQFRRHYRPDHPTVGPALSGWVTELLGDDCTPVYGSGKLPAGATAGFLLSNPSDGSACKRMNLFLRWMVRNDALDTGLWDFVRPDQLVLPLDAHLSRIVRYLGLTRRATNDWIAAAEATASLKLLDPADPLKYDFALCRLGILKDCPAKPDRTACSACMLLPVCRAGASRTRVRKTVQKSDAMITAVAASASEPT